MLETLANVVLFVLMLGFQIYWLSNFLLPLFYSIPRSLPLCVSGRCKWRYPASCIGAALVWLLVPIGLGYLLRAWWPMALSFVMGSWGCRLGYWVGLIGFLLSLFSRKTRHDIRSEFEDGIRRHLKPTIHLGGFARKLLSDAYAHIVTMEDPAGEVDTERVLTPLEREIANRAFYDFKFAVVYSFLFIKIAEGKLKADIAAFTKYTMHGLWMALKDGGMLDERAKEEAERIWDEFKDKYGDLLDGHGKAGTQEGLDFMICHSFANQTLNLDVRNDSDGEKHFILFSMSKNLLKLTFAYAEEQFANVNLICTP